MTSAGLFALVVNVDDNAYRDETHDMTFSMTSAGLFTSVVSVDDDANRDETHDDCQKLEKTVPTWGQA